jgi:hypothetical protein
VKSRHFSLTHGVGSDALLALPVSALALDRRYRGWAAQCHVFGAPLVTAGMPQMMQTLGGTDHSWEFCAAEFGSICGCDHDREASALCQTLSWLWRQLCSNQPGDTLEHLDPDAVSGEA